MSDVDLEDDDVVAGQGPEGPESGESHPQIKKVWRKKHQMLPPGQGRFLTREKERKALELRKGGASYASIAQAVGYKTESSARKAVLRAFGTVIQEPVAELRSLQVERLNHMLLTLWPKIQSGDERTIMTALAVMDRIDKISGTEAAQKVDVNVHHDHAVLVVDGDKDAYIRAMKRMAGIDANGRNRPKEIEQPPVQVIDDDVRDAELVEEEVPEPQAPARVYRFGVDPVHLNAQA